MPHVAPIKTCAVIAATLLAVTPPANAGISGKALLTDAPSRVKPGNLILCTLAGGEKKSETLVKGQVIDARFSPDGKSVVYGAENKIFTMNLVTKAIHEVGTYTSSFTTFTWGTGDAIYFSDGDADGTNMREIYRIQISTKEKKKIGTSGTDGRITTSVDGKRAAWIIPPVCAEIGGSTFSYMGGCGGAISPSGKYLTSNLTTSHKLMGIFEFNNDGPTKKPIATVSARFDHAINGFSFSRSDEWVCYTVEDPKAISPIAYVAYWRADEHVEIAPKHCIKDFFDETDLTPADGELEKITVCSNGPSNTPIEHTTTHIEMNCPLKVVAHYTVKGHPGKFTPQVRDSITWTTDNAKVAVTATGLKGIKEGTTVAVTAKYQGKSYTFDVTVLPKLTGDGFKGEYFADKTYTQSALTRIDPFVDFVWTGSQSPATNIKGTAPWSVRWTGKLEVAIEGDYVFSFLQGEGNDRMIKLSDTEKICGYSVNIDDSVVIAPGSSWNYPWSSPKASKPVKLTKGTHVIKIETIDCSDQPVTAQLYWSGPEMPKPTLLGAPYVNSK